MTRYGQCATEDEVTVARRRYVREVSERREALGNRASINAPVWAAGWGLSEEGDSSRLAVETRVFGGGAG